VIPALRRTRLSLTLLVSLVPGIAAAQK